uniref:Uncharacterized protein n=1 Tax=Triticum urartu TaxID=4572 RepID=A0A8R7QT13_TRIUA
GGGGELGEEGHHVGLERRGVLGAAGVGGCLRRVAVDEGGGDARALLRGRGGGDEDEEEEEEEEGRRRARHCRSRSVRALVGALATAMVVLVAAAQED